MTVLSIMPLAEFTVYGTPEPAGSKRGFNTGAGVRVVDANPKAKDWKRMVAQVAGEHTDDSDPLDDGLFDGPLAVEFQFYVPRPLGHFGTGRNSGMIKRSSPLYPTTRPDALKLARAVEDALTGVLYRDDSQIVYEILSKHYGTPARVHVRVWRPSSADASMGAAA